MAKRILLVLTVSVLTTTVALADPVAWEFTTVGNEFTDGHWTFGEVFSPTSNINITFLGYYNPTGSMADRHPVGIFDAAGDLLTSTVVTSSSSFSSTHFLYNAVTPVALQAGHTYVIEGVSGTDVYAWNDPGFTVSAPITVLGNNYVLDGGLTFNGTGLINNVSDGYWGPDFRWTLGTPVPEPGSMLLFGSGIVGVAELLRRKLSVRARGTK